ncbi:PorV/PorQ family protein [Flavobacterium sp. NKUCC04_CG]|uniref:putative type IX sorting system protein PorV2 n=1 Tax=Flavobacterium sp. NKUCC04_CG TaxID=2842121 RepID=UPI001C5B69BD
MKNILLLSLLLVTGTIHAQKVRKYSNEFMNIGVDAAAMGMANSVVASTDNVNATYWNPAGLIHLDTKQLSLMHASYFANIAQYDYVAFAMPIDEKSAVGLSLIRFGVDDIMNTTELIDQNGNIDYNRISLFSTADYAFTASYARKLPIEGLSIGVNAKIIRRIIGKFANSWGFGFDIGAQYQTNSGWKYALMARDITTTYNMWSINKKEFEKISNAIPGQNSELPETTEITMPKLQFGMARKFNLTDDFSVLPAVGINMEFAETQALISTKGFSVSPTIGAEFAYTDMVFVRGGIGNFQNTTQLDGSEKIGFQPNIGVGFQYRGIQIDYALTDIGDQSVALYSNVFSLKLNLDIFSR